MLRELCQGRVLDSDAWGLPMVLKFGLGRCRRSGRWPGSRRFGTMEAKTEAASQQISLLETKHCSMCVEHTFTRRFLIRQSFAIRRPKSTNSPDQPR